MVVRSTLPDTPYWFVLATSTELGSRPLARTLWGTPLVLFRDAEGHARTLLDRCPHRNVPLSLGEVVRRGPQAGRISCVYHGWQFDGAGQCRHVPSLLGEAEHPSRCVESFATQEQDGFVWVYAKAHTSPTHPPFRFPLMDDKRYTRVRQITQAKANVFASAENALDVPHTAFLHRGLFRTANRNLRLDVKVIRTSERVEAHYLGEPRPQGLMARLLSPSGGTVEHVDRFLLPSIAQVEYALGAENHVLVTSAMTPVTETETRLYNIVALRTRIPGVIVAPFVKPVALQVFAQDAIILEAQTRTVETFGGEHFASTPIDVLGKHIAHFLRRVRRGEPPEVLDRQEELTQLTV